MLMILGCIYIDYRLLPSSLSSNMEKVTRIFIIWDRKLRWTLITMLMIGLTLVLCVKFPSYIMEANALHLASGLSWWDEIMRCFGRKSILPPLWNSEKTKIFALLSHKNLWSARGSHFWCILLDLKWSSTLLMDFLDSEEVEAWKYNRNVGRLWKPTRVLCCYWVCSGNGQYAESST